ncbi:acyl-CoA carboxylase epsilon subunit [Actinokineospora sp. G85]|uniref:acyl-CoA carboxylase epsilon subunit n=1 Tax=Actinokineospora sp. G85 TaxID=3406626 RepID=UPI003C73C431
MRVEKGNPDDEELAALTAVLLLGLPADHTPPRRAPVALWRRLDRAPGFDCPRTWRADSRQSR